MKFFFKNLKFFSIKRTIKSIFIWIKTLFTLDNLTILGIWLLKWTSIFLAIGVFVWCSMQIGQFIGGKTWIVFVADLLFYIAFWALLSLSKHTSYTGRLSSKYMKRAVMLLVFLLLMFILIAMATLGVSAITSSMILINIYVFIIGFIATWGIFLYYSHRKSISENF
jgi:hypothetical protein